MGIERLRVRIQDQVLTFSLLPGDALSVWWTECLVLGWGSGGVGWEVGGGHETWNVMYCAARLHVNDPTECRELVVMDNSYNNSTSRQDSLD